MVETALLYDFSPTGGTRKVGELFCNAIGRQVKEIDLMGELENREPQDCSVVVVAAPVFGGRIPKIAAERIRELDGKGRKAVAMAVYGTRAYEDALLELQDVLRERGFCVIAAGAFIAQHSIVPEVGKGRPDEKDAQEIRDFAAQVEEKLKAGSETEVSVPGNRPYKEAMQVPATPISLSACNRCGACAKVCPVNAISIVEDGVKTDKEACILCMACTAHCPSKARILPPPLQEGMEKKLGALKETRRENEAFV